MLCSGESKIYQSRQPLKGGGGANLKFFQKLHENKEILTLSGTFHALILYTLLSKLDFQVENNIFLFSHIVEKCISSLRLFLGQIGHCNIRGAFDYI